MNDNSGVMYLLAWLVGVVVIATNCETSTSSNGRSFEPGPTARKWQRIREQGREATAPIVVEPPAGDLSVVVEEGDLRVTIERKGATP